MDQLWKTILKNDTAIAANPLTCVPLSNMSLYYILYTLYIDISLYVHMNKSK